MEPNLKIKKSAEIITSTEYRKAIGTLLFTARNSRPDIVYSVGYLSRFQTSATEETFKYIKRILRYLKGITHYYLEYLSDDKLPLTAYVDASFGNDINDYKSTIGYIIFSFGDPICGSSRKQSLVTTSTTAAEFVALNDAIADRRFIRALNSQILGIIEPTKVFEDNESTIRIANGADQGKVKCVLISEEAIPTNSKVNGKPSLHVAVKQAAVREAVENRENIMEKISGLNQIADILTKSCDTISFERQVACILNTKNLP